MLPLEIREYCYYLSQCQRKKICLEELLCSVEQADPREYDKCGLFYFRTFQPWVRFEPNDVWRLPCQVNWGLIFPGYQLFIAKSSCISISQGKCPPRYLRNCDYASPFCKIASKASFDPPIYRDLFLVKHSGQNVKAQYCDTHMQLLPCYLQN